MRSSIFHPPHRVVVVVALDVDVARRAIDPTLSLDRPRARPSPRAVHIRARIASHRIASRVPASDRWNCS